MSSIILTLQCVHCKTWFPHEKPGMLPSYCRPACRQQAFYKRYKKRTGHCYKARPTE